VRLAETVAGRLVFSVQNLVAKEAAKMPLVLEFVCYLVAFLCFLAAMFGVSFGRISPLAAGLAAWVLVPLANVMVKL
jgi:uncharacterized membrane protein YoaT (DUF817 family)